MLKPWMVVAGLLALVVSAAAAPPSLTGMRKQQPMPASRGSETAPAVPAAATHLPDCLVYLIEDIQVPALEAGPLVTINVKEGDVVEPGQLLALLDDSQP